MFGIYLQHVSLDFYADLVYLQDFPLLCLVGNPVTHISILSLFGMLVRPYVLSNRGKGLVRIAFLIYLMYWQAFPFLGLSCSKYKHMSIESLSLQFGLLMRTFVLPNWKKKMCQLYFSVFIYIFTYKTLLLCLSCPEFYHIIDF